MTSEKDCVPWHPYHTRAKARIMSEMEQAQEQVKSDVETLKEQMSTVMEAMLSMKKMMEVNTTATAANASVVVEKDPNYPPGFN